MREERAAKIEYVLSKLCAGLIKNYKKALKVSLIINHNKITSYEHYAR